MRFCNPAPVKDEVSGPPTLAAVNEVDNNLNDVKYAVAEQQFFWGNKPGNQAIEELMDFYEKKSFGVKICLCYRKD